MEIFGIAITFLAIVLAWLTWNNGRWIKESLKTINEQGELRHKEVLDWFKKMDEREVKRDDREVKRDDREEKRENRAEQRHKEVMDWFKQSEERGEQRHKEVIAITAKLNT